MKTKSVLRLGASVLVLASGARADDLPKTPNFSRYEAMMNRSPFAVATAIAPPPQAPNFAKDFYIANAARLPDEGLVTVTSSVDHNMKEFLSTKGPNKNGYSISNIEWSDRVGATKVTISKDGQFATLTFNQALLSQPLPAGAIPPSQVNLQPPPPLPGGGPSSLNQGGIRPAPIPTLPTPPPRVRGVIPRNPQAAATPAPTINQIVPDEP